LWGRILQKISLLLRPQSVLAYDARKKEGIGGSLEKDSLPQSNRPIGNLCRSSSEAGKLARRRQDCQVWQYTIYRTKLIVGQNRRLVSAMTRLSRRTMKPPGSPPGTLLHTGERKREKMKLTVIDYDDAGITETELESVEACVRFKDSTRVTWLNVEGLHDVEALERLGEYFGLHHLVLEDILDTDQRPKVEDYGDYMFVLARVSCCNQERDEVDTEQVSLVLFPKIVITFEEGGIDVFAAVRDRIRMGKGRIRQRGTDYLLYALLDGIVDGYLVTLAGLGERIESMEEEIVTDPGPYRLNAIHTLRTQIASLRRIVWPLREVIHSLDRGAPALFDESTTIYVRDLYDHTMHVVDTIETFRDTLSGMLDVHLSSVSQRMNEVMKVLTIIATIFIPITFIAGVYGMNFQYMPELEFPWAYPTALGVMLAVAVGMIVYFRKKKWL
jgi:magnesium transporter